MSTKSFTTLKESFLFETNYVTDIGSKVFIYPFIGRSKFAILCFILICTLLCITIVQLVVSLIVSKFEVWFEIINIAPNLGVSVLILIKYIKIHTNQNIYDNIIKHFRNDVWDVIQTKSEKHKCILKRYTYLSRIIVRFMYYYMIVLVSVIGLLPRIIMFYNSKITSNNAPYLYYPFDGWYPFDKVKWYNTVFLWETLMTTMVIVLYVFGNIMHISFTLYICLELTVLGSTIGDLISSADRRNISKQVHVKETHDIIKMNLKTIIKRHQLLIRMVADLDQILGLAMLLIYIFGSVFICLTLLTALIVDDLFQSLRYFSFFCSLLIEVFIQCIIGQLLIDHSKGLEQAIYFFDWPYADRETKRMLLIFLIRAQRPLTLSAKGYLIMNLNTFGGVCSLSYQFFNVLRTAYY